MENWKLLVRDAVIVASVTITGTVLAMVAVLGAINLLWPDSGITEIIVVRPPAESEQAPGPKPAEAVTPPAARRLGEGGGDGASGIRSGVRIVRT